MNTKRGFTLVELLVAATIIGALAAFATVQYRNSVAETRWEGAKAKVHQLAAAIQRLQADYPGVQAFSSSSFEDVANPKAECPLYPGISSRLGNGATVPPSALITCGYVDNGGWSNEFWQYTVRYRRPLVYSGTGTCNGGLACVSAKEGAKLPESYTKLRYSVDKEGVGSTDEPGSGGPSIVLW